MARNCNLELRLVTPSVHFHSADYSASRSDMADSSSKEEKQKLTIFYNGRITACDVTDLQARAIILLANRETEDEKSIVEEKTSSTTVQSPGYNPPNGLYMKRSLQRFLQKRKNRAQATSPYSQSSQ
ncbi:protein TIFY 5A [Andrographis paniculata]|uniref:protein TIFY 5A n=1 Tax=Andrographis paniculata TaxID=175694 RepID=UPI0021E90F28|nr:protein TIFY 5A [Andrographis paniculata]